jgi:tRNA-modifying protein YgfZ
MRAFAMPRRVIHSCAGSSTSQSFARSGLKRSPSCRASNAAGTLRSSYGSYNTAKGRMLATCLVLRVAEGAALVLAADVAAAITKRLSMYVMRAKLRVTDAAADDVVIGVAGPHVDATLSAIGVTLPAVAHQGADDSHAGVWTRLDNGRALGVISRTQLETTLAQLSAAVPRVHSDAWGWLDIQAGIPYINTATQDQLVAQMANLELIGGVSFNKGCYPGQEIVARTQHLGRIKRRMVGGHVASETVAAGDAIVGADLGDQASGVVVAALPAPDAGFDLLAVMQTSTIESNMARLRRLDGAPIALRALPYTATV